MTTIPNFTAPAADQPHPPLRCQLDDLPAGYPTLPDLRFYRSRKRPQRTVVLGPDWARKAMRMA